ncbi:MAG: T9SS type A sorting domain-containing protein [Segetibacter sp.]
MTSSKAIQKLNASDESVSMQLSPNPVSNILNISTTGFQQNKPLTISVLSISGVLNKTIHSSTSNHVVQVDVSSLQKGVYIVRIISGDKMMNKQFIKL